MSSIVHECPPIPAQTSLLISLSLQHERAKERDIRQDIPSVTHKLPSGQTSVQVPQTQSLIPRGRQGKLAVGRDGNVRDKVVVAVQDLLGETKVGVIPGELPDDEGLVC